MYSATINTLPPPSTAGCYIKPEAQDKDQQGRSHQPRRGQRQIDTPERLRLPLAPRLREASITRVSSDCIDTSKGKHRIGDHVVDHADQHAQFVAHKCNRLGYQSRCFQACC